MPRLSPRRFDDGRADVAHRVPGLDEAAQAERGEPACLVRRYSSIDVHPRLLLEVVRQLLVDFAINGAATEKSASKGEPSGQHAISPGGVNDSTGLEYALDRQRELFPAGGLRLQATAPARRERVDTGTPVVLGRHHLRRDVAS